MPLYTYTCTKCHHVHDALAPVQFRNVPPKCPLCGAVTVRQVTSAVLRFRGDGWQTPKAQDG